MSEIKQLIKEAHDNSGGVKMARITDAERKRFHIILDDSIDKMNSPKNSKKTHWKHFSIYFLRKRGREEKQELKEALEQDFSNSEILSECYDNINFALMIADNLSREKILKKKRQKVIKRALKNMNKEQRP